MKQRLIKSKLIESLEDTPVIFLRGARQVGKTTLVKDILQSGHAARYVTLDSATQLAAAASDPEGFVRQATTPLAIDEIQKVPALLPAIKLVVDENRAPGRFILTGSADFTANLTVQDSLAGRMETFTLWPLSMGEIEGSRENFVDALFGPKATFPLPARPNWKASEAILAGGFPEAQARRPGARRRAWFDSYVTAILERDVRDLANIQDVSALPRLLQLLASRCAALANVSALARDLGMPGTTVQRHLALLKATFLIYGVPAWATNLGKRLVKAPKFMFTDTGLAAAVLGLDGARLERDRNLLGPLLENLVASEVRKQCGFAATSARVFHFRDAAGKKVDLVLEDTAGNVVGVEVKASSSVGSSDFSGLRALQEMAGPRFVRGALLYLGQEAAPFGPDLWAAPVSCL